MPPSGCPALTPEIVPTDPAALSPTAPWQPAHEPPRLNSSHFFMYVPPLFTDDDQLHLREVIRANQFPADPSACNRTLVLYDDALSAGLGYTAKLIALALLVAVQEKRVLIMMNHSTARWCARYPHTLSCFYEPITHCPPPLNLSMSPKWATRGSSMGLEYRRAHSANVMRISTSQIHKSTFWYKFHPPQQLFAATHELLYKPREWVREAARCVMRAASLEGENFAVVHARYSVEKKKERGARLPGLPEYLKATQKLLEDAGGASRVFLQTSTPDAVELFEKWSVENKWSLTYTQNKRTQNDLWMHGAGKKAEYHASGEQASVVAQSVNALIASRSRHFLSPSSSMWTSFIRALMGRRVGDKVTDGGGSTKELQLRDDCLQVWHNVHNLNNRSNVSLAEHKRCHVKSPTLLTIHRRVTRPEEAADCVECSRT